MPEIERESLAWKCRSKDCPWPNDEDLHRTPWCAAIKGHTCWGGSAHQHRPKKGMGGKNPDAKIVALICRRMSDCVDNGLADEGNRHYRDEVLGGKYVIYLRGKKVDRVVLSKQIPKGESDGASGDYIDDLGRDSRAGLDLGRDEQEERRGGIHVTGDTPATLADWSALTDDELSLLHEEAVKQLQNGLLLKCRVIWQYKQNHVQEWGQSWIENAYERFGGSRRTLEGYAGFWQTYVTSDGYLQEQVGVVAESRSLVQHIGRQNVATAATVLKEAIDYVAEYGEPPTVAALAHRASGEEEEREKCPACGQYLPRKRE